MLLIDLDALIRGNEVRTVFIDIKYLVKAIEHTQTEVDALMIGKMIVYLGHDPFIALSFYASVEHRERVEESLIVGILSGL